MSKTSLIRSFNEILDFWIQELEHYDDAELRLQPEKGSWSLGQVVMHLIADTNYYLEQIEVCLKSNDHAHDQASDRARKMLLNNDFPDERIEGNPENINTINPKSKAVIEQGLLDLKDRANELAARMARSEFNGKALHPGFLYLNAYEWLQLAEMHFRHHLRQKKRIDQYLKSIHE